jgi:flagellar biosynthesis protein FlhB
MADHSQELRTVEATPRKVEQARRAGQGPVSRELTSGLVVLATGVVILACGRAALGGLVLFFRQSISAATGEFAVGSALVAGLHAISAALAVPLVVMLVAALAVGIVQTRGLIRTGLLKPTAQRIAPRLGRLWGIAGLATAGAACARVAALVTVAWLGSTSAVSAIASSSGSGASRVLDCMFVLAKHLGLGLAFTLLGLGMADFLWQVHRHRKALRMSHDEVKRERKDTEGDPILKAERQRIHAELSQANALAQLAQADLVVSDPGRVVAVLRYDPAAFGAPVVICKGRNHLAIRLEALASRAGVPVVVKAALAEQLAREEEGDEIPESLYEPIADLLASRRRTLAGNAAGGGARYAR